MTRIFRYILASDNGMAPCIDDGLISLATCKPAVRASARPGDWVIGCFPKPAPRGVVAWAARVAECVPVGEYERRHRGRSDAVYREKPDGTFRPLRPSYHPEPDQRRKDTRSPVLVFDEAAAWYFGDQPEMLPDELMHLAAAGQGHRVNDRKDGDLQALQAWLSGLSSPGVVGKPRHPPLPPESRSKC